MLVPAEVMGELVTQGPLDLAGEQLPVVAEITFQCVAVDHDPVLIAIARDAVAEVLAVGVLFTAEIGDDDRDALENLLEFLRQGVDCVRDQRLEVIRLRLIHWPNVIQEPIGGTRI